MGFYNVSHVVLKFIFNELKPTACTLFPRVLQI